MPFYVFAWIASFSFGLAVIIGKFTSKYSIANPWLFSFLYALFTLLFTIPPAIANQVGLPKVWDNIILASFFTALAFIFYSLALYRLDVSVLGPLFQIRTGLTVLLGALLVGEFLTGSQYLLVGVIFLAGMFASTDEKFSLRSFFQRSVALAVIGMVTLSLMAIYIKKAMAQNGYWEVTLWSGVVCQIFLLVTVPFFTFDLVRISSTQIKVMIILALADITGLLASNKAYADNVSISTAIISLPFSMIMAIFLSFLAPALLEKHSIKVYAIRLGAALVMFLAALKLST